MTISHIYSPQQYPESTKQKQQEIVDALLALGTVRRVHVDNISKWQEDPENPVNQLPLVEESEDDEYNGDCLLYTSPSPRD